MALNLLRNMNIQPGQKVLVNGASGGIGSATVQIARITEESVEAVMLPISYRVLLSKIKQINTTDIPWYTNWGLRIQGRKLSFVSMHKKAVKIEKENGFFRTLVLTARDPIVLLLLIIWYAWKWPRKEESPENKI